MFFVNFISSGVRAQQEGVDKNRIADYFQNEQYNEAIEYLVSDTADHPNDIYILNSLGYAYYMNKDFKKAEQYYLESFKTDTLNFTANRLLASIYTNLNVMMKLLFATIDLYKPNLPTGFYSKA